MNFDEIKNMILEHEIVVKNDFFGNKVNFSFEDKNNTKILVGYYEYDAITEEFFPEKCFVIIQKNKLYFNDDIKFIFIYAKQRIIDILYSRINHVKEMLYNKLGGIEKYGTLLDIYEENISMFAAKNVPKERIMYRARVGKKPYIFEKSELPQITIFTPYNREEIRNPASKFVRQNRFNHEGKSVYYLASDIDTCISEVRVLVGEDISVAKFKSTQSLKLIDFSIDYKDISLETIKMICISTVGNENTTDYVLTNYFSDIFKSLGYDGIYYKSSQGSGENICCFYPQKIELVEYSEKLFRVTSNKHSYIPSPFNVIDKDIKDTSIDFIDKHYNDERIKYIKKWNEKVNNTID